ncbi:uncharacterized protein LOC132739474 isoform X2 [Ruditapes philippinarum]|uniref:uncharacterized protein LOC132739474 isoform X2 n=1 Tax=Ruditapes philippinarum TaxID=129788 RepID=UPI00295B29F9|nr:uncharacterized protein LOC132739474 isoform X2 [Ruditapes philippinarum]
MFEDSLAITLSSHFCKLHKVCIACLYASPFILQTVGLFTTNWIINDTCDSVGIFYYCCGGPDNDTCRPSQIEDGLDTTGRDLQISSFVMMLIGLLMFFVGIPCACGLFKISKPERDRLYDRTLHACCDILFGCVY